MEKVTLLGIDIAKNIFQLYGVNIKGEKLMVKSLKRNGLLKYVATNFALPCRIVMEACGGAHYWGREFQRLGFGVELISPQFVKPYVKTNKNDLNDAEGIVTAARQPNMRYVPIKNLEQQDIQSIHRVRERLIGNRTALVNQIRGLLAEYGVVLAQGVSHVRNGLPLIVEDAENGLTMMAREEFNMLYEELTELNKRIATYEKKINQVFNANPICKKLSKVEGVGPITATILLTVLSDPSLFKNGRHFAAFLGLVPKQYSSGGKQRLLGISKRGDTYIRGLLIHGGRSVVKTLGKKADRRSTWAKQLKERRGYNRTAVAVANKNARILWSIIANDTEYKKAA